MRALARHSPCAREIQKMMNYYNLDELKENERNEFFEDWCEYTDTDEWN